MNRTGPMGSSSIGFSTGSVVVPATSETINACCREIAIKINDFPAFRRPKMPMWRRKDFGEGRIGVGCVRLEESGKFGVGPK